MPTLSIQLPGLPPVSHVLKDETITIGRMKGNTIVIEDTSISLMHAKITRKNGDFLLKDLNSTNGTIVNGQPIGEAKLRDQDRVRFAEIACQFLADAALAPEQPIQTQQISIPPRPAPLPITAAPTAVTPQLPVAAAPAPAVAVPAAPKTAPVRRVKRPSALLFRFAIPAVIIAGTAFAGWKVYLVNQQNLEKLKAGDSAQSLANHSEGVPDKLQSSPSKFAQKAKAASETAGAGDSEPWVPKASTEGKPPAQPQKESVAQLIQALKNGDPIERQRAAAALHSLGAEAKDAIPALRESLKDKDQDVQMWAALALVNNQEYDKGVVPILVRVLHNENPVLRQVACLSLGLISYQESEKDPVILPLKETADKDGNEDVRKAAASALSIIAPEAIAKTGAK